MNKPNFFALTRPEMPQEGPKTFVEPRYKDKRHLDVTLTLQALDNIETGKVSALAQRKMLQYVGVPEDGIEPEEDFPPTEGYIAELNDDICLKAARLYYMQRTDKESQKYSFEEFVILSVMMPNVWERVLEWQYKLRNAAKAEPKKPSGDASISEA